MARKKGKEMDTRAALLDAAWALFQEKGFASSSVDAIVLRAGLSKGTFFHYFPSKRHLLEAVCDRVLTTSFSALAPALLDEKRRPGARLNLLLTSMREWRLAHAGTLTDLWRSLAREENSALRLELTALADGRVFPLLRSIIAAGNAQRAFRVTDVDETARLILAVLNSGGTANLETLTDAHPGRGLARALQRRSDAVLVAIERMLGARRGTLERVDLASLERQLRVSGRRVSAS